MRLLRFGLPGQEKWGVVDAGGFARELPGDALSSLTAPTCASMDALSNIDLSSLPIVPSNTRLGPPVVNCRKIICVGLNYSEHARESGAESPKEPILFMKAASALCGPHDDILMPRGCTKLDWEVELAVVIGRSGRDIKENEARAHVAGFSIINDVSERAFQLEGTGQWVKGKSADTFAPLGPWLVTTDEIADPGNLALWLDVNGSRRQNSSTQCMIFGVDSLISYVSQFMSLHPGDIIATGTPAGVGLGMNPPSYLNAGDVVELGITGLGMQRQTVRNPHHP